MNKKYPVSISFEIFFAWFFRQDWYIARFYE